MVGPLNEGGSMKALPLKYCYNSARNYTDVTSVSDFDALVFTFSAASNISDITMDLLGAKVDPDKILFFDQTGLLPFMRQAKGTDSHYVYWMGLLRPGSIGGEWGLLPQGIRNDRERF
jgi:hypothetical protein